ncbi:hypothetical protein CDV55_103135 [Aspergillus turcosus]|uniref:Uncharacterized protein n=1 Tax=Aspergillus turcosus TaxID=1245748 RepID=A0A229YR92_9EURO|nr:hypothetical protein CDV55_103135 [Aspergillus turcosus]RLL96214.1 hypothetical protein CFD26_105135 [Aspergillus turcosus]
MGRPRKSKPSRSQEEENRAEGVDSEERPEEKTQSESGRLSYQHSDQCRDEHSPDRDEHQLPLTWSSPLAAMAQISPVQLGLPVQSILATPHLMAPAASSESGQHGGWSSRPGLGSDSVSVTEHLPLDDAALVSMVSECKWPGDYAAMDSDFERIQRLTPSVPDWRLDVYGQLSPILLRLNEDRQSLKRGTLSTDRSLDELFSTISALCDTVQIITQLGGSSMPSINAFSEEPQQSGQGTLMLALTAVCMSIEIYELLAVGPEDKALLLLQGLDGSERRDSISGSGNERHCERSSVQNLLRPTSSGHRQRSHTTGRVGAVVRYTVMDFHLGQLGQLLHVVADYSWTGYEVGFRN